MKLAVSNIAWEQHDDPETLQLLKKHNVEGIEVAPTKVWQNWEGANTQSALRYKQFLANFELDIPAMQAILFGKPHLQLLDRNHHIELKEHIKLVAEIAEALGAKVLVFGAPKNRRRNQRSAEEAKSIAIDIFSQLADICHQHNCCIGLESNPVEYGSDFIINVADAHDIVQEVSHPGMRLHLDIAGIHMCGEKTEPVIKNAGNFVHYHISEPMLAPIAGGEVDHQAAFRALKECGYTNWVSIEMKTPADPDLLEKSLVAVNDIRNAI